MKAVGMVLVIVGVSICAAQAARLAPIVAESVPQILATEQKVGKAKTAYCKARSDAKLSAFEVCNTRNLDPAGAPADGGEKLTGLATSWVDAYAKLEVIRSEKPIPGPQVRLTSWFSVAGLFFLGGFVLLVAGALISRKALRDEVMAKAPGGGDGSGASRELDFGEQFGALAQTVAELAERLNAAQHESPVTGGRVLPFKENIESIQRDAVEPIVDQRMRLQIRYGIGQFADVFGPFSAGERRLNRVWSCLVDGYPHEAVQAAQIAAAQFAAANDAFKNLR